MKTSIAGAVCIVLLAAASAPAHEVKHKGLAIVHPWTVPTANAAPKDVTVYLKVRNLGTAADRLLSASSPRAASVRLLEPGDADTPPVASLALRPGAELRPRLVLIGFVEALDTYESFPMTLMFAKAGRLEIEVYVEEAQGASPKPP